MIRSINNRGFTLLEMLVSLGIFSIVVVIAVGSLVKITGLNRQAQALQASMNNVSFAMESMSREMRVGTNFSCMDGNNVNINWSNSSSNSLPANTCVTSTAPGNQAANNARIIAFNSSKTAAGNNYTCNLIYAYRVRWDGLHWNLEKAEQTACGQTPTFLPMLDSTNVTLTDYRLGVYRGTQGYGFAFIRLIGYSGIKEADKNYFDLQTAVSDRISD